MMIKVAISDAHAVTREGVRTMLEHASNFDVVGEAFDGASTLALVRSTEAHVLTLGLSMPGVHGFELITQIKSERPSLRILVLTMYPEEVFASLAFKAGASGFITKNSSKPDIVAAIRKIRSGGTISTYRAHILEKMEMSRDAALVRYALHHKLVEDDGLSGMPTAAWSSSASIHS